ncbi:MAG: hypothetical protein Q8R15_02170 [Candidatus Micrarchaeota archaeon]|nr:hypothetical protein [Candidatus Micrarchaeota archaeon]
MPLIAAGKLVRAIVSAQDPALLQHYEIAINRGTVNVTREHGTFEPKHVELIRTLAAKMAKRSKVNFAAEVLTHEQPQRVRIQFTEKETQR